jgi:nucleoside 2-deoxyribosyltransferase
MQTLEDIRSNGILGHGLFRKAFVAAPMSAFDTDDAYRKSRKDILNIIKHLKNKYDFSNVYYAGEKIDSQSEFNSTTLALKADISALNESDLFILYYPKKVASSVLVEAGFAFAKEIPMLLLVENEEDLPYLFREVNGVPAEKGCIPSISICKFDNSDDLLLQLDLGINRLSEILIDSRP